LTTLGINHEFPRHTRHDSTFSWCHRYPQCWRRRNKSSGY
jgi:hypothetical protein